MADDVKEIFEEADKFIHEQRCNQTGFKMFGAIVGAIAFVFVFLFLTAVFSELCFIGVIIGVAGVIIAILDAGDTLWLKLRGRC